MKTAGLPAERYSFSGACRQFFRCVRALSKTALCSPLLAVFRVGSRMFYKFSVSASRFHHLACCAMLALTLAACSADNTSGMTGQSTTTTSQAGGDFFVNGVPPRTAVRVGAMYRYVPASSSQIGRVLSYAITNKPEWATFGETNGELSGIPAMPSTV